MCLTCEEPQQTHLLTQIHVRVSYRSFFLFKWWSPVHLFHTRTSSSRRRITRRKNNNPYSAYMCLYCSDWIIEWISQLSTSTPPCMPHTHTHTHHFCLFTNFHVSAGITLYILFFVSFFLWQMLLRNAQMGPEISLKEVDATRPLFFIEHLKNSTVIQRRPMNRFREIWIASIESKP